MTNKWNIDNPITIGKSVDAVTRRLGRLDNYGAGELSRMAADAFAGNNEKSTYHGDALIHDHAAQPLEADEYNDTFKCDRCGRVCDIEDSIRQGKDKLNCVYCTAPSPPTPPLTAQPTQNCITCGNPLPEDQYCANCDNTAQPTHTPTPWNSQPIDDDFTGIYDTDGDRIGRVTHDANAAFIVRAVNNHDALVAALREALPMVESAYLDDAERLGERAKTTQATFTVLQTIRAALSAVEGE